MKVDQELLTKIDYLLANHKSIPAQFVNTMPPDLDAKYIGKHRHNYVWLLDYYQSNGYDGTGERIGINLDIGKLVYGFTSHCSCNEPWDGGDGDETGRFKGDYKEAPNTEATYKQFDLDQKD